MDQIVVERVLNELAKQFNTTVEYLVPRIQQYKMMTSLFGAIVSAIFMVIIFATVNFIWKKLTDEDSHDTEDFIYLICINIASEFIPTIICLVNIWNYIGWRYAAEIKTIEYVMNLIKQRG